MALDRLDNSKDLIWRICASIHSDWPNIYQSETPFQDSERSFAIPKFSKIEIFDYKPKAMFYKKMGELMNFLSKLNFEADYPWSHLD